MAALETHRRCNLYYSQVRLRCVLLTVIIVLTRALHGANKKQRAAGWQKAETTRERDGRTENVESEGERGRGEGQLVALRPASNI